MCRAVCEDVLKQHFGLPIPKNRRGYGPDLGELIKLAEKEYEWVKQLELYLKVKDVNEILHAYDRSTKITTTDEKKLLDFLTTVKTLIERAPSLGEIPAPRR